MLAATDDEELPDFRWIPVRPKKVHASAAPSTCLGFSDDGRRSFDAARHTRGASIVESRFERRNPMSQPNVVPHQTHHSVPGADLTLLGAHSTVTGAMSRLEIGGRTLLVDAGVTQGKDARRSPALDGKSVPDGALDVDALILTHGHNDHVGSVPALIEHGFDKPVIATPATFEIADLILRDGLRIQGASERDVTRFRTRFRTLFQPLRYDTPLALGGASLCLREAGHIIGSSSVDVATAEARVILSGDLGRPQTPLLQDPTTDWRRAGPDGNLARPADLVLLETTYGDREHAHSHGDIEGELLRILSRAKETGGHILVPAFAIGRTQTLLYHLNTLVESGRLTGLPVAVDTPLGLRVTDTYESFSRLFDEETLVQIARGDDPLDFDALYSVKKGRDSVRLRDVDGPILIIAGSGMCTGGRIVGHLRELLPDDDTTVLFIGYQASGTTGRRIQKATKGEPVSIDGEDVVVRANIETLSGLSAHADRTELRRWLEHIPASEALHIALHHGDVRAQDAFAKWLAG